MTQPSPVPPNSGQHTLAQPPQPWDQDRAGREATTAQQLGPGVDPARESDAPRERSGWWLGLLALLPIACCGLPLLLAAGVTASSGAALGGITGAVLVGAGAGASGVWLMRRRTHRHAETPTTTGHGSDQCC